MHEGRPLPMSPRAVSSQAAWRHHVWLALLVVAVSAFSFVAACATPFAAFAAVAALTLSRGDAFRITVALWLADQIVGYAIHGYPRTPESFAWGAAIGAAALLATWTARWTVTRLQAAAPLTRALSALLGAFAVYEGTLLAVAVSGLGGTESFTPGDRDPDPGRQRRGIRRALRPAPGRSSDRSQQLARPGPRVGRPARLLALTARPGVGTTIQWRASLRERARDDRAGDAAGPTRSPRAWSVRE